MAGTLKDELVAIRARLQTDLGVTVEIRESLPFDATSGQYQPPTTETHVIIEVLQGATTQTQDADVFSDGLIQVGAWSRVGLTSAMTLAKNAGVSMAAEDYLRDGGPRLIREDDYRGVIATYLRVAAFDAIA